MKKNQFKFLIMFIYFFKKNITKSWIMKTCFGIDISIRKKNSVKMLEFRIKLKMNQF